MRNLRGQLPHLHLQSSCGEDILNIADSEREIRHVFLFSGFGHNSSDSVSIANLEPGITIIVSIFLKAGGGGGGGGGGVGWFFF